MQSLSKYQGVFCVKGISKFIWKQNGLKTAKAINIYHKINIIKTVWYYCKAKQNRSNKENKTITSFMVRNNSTVVSVSFPNGKHEFWPWILLHTPQFQMDIRSNEHIINENIKWLPPCS